MSKAALTSFIIDLKLTPDHEVKILEMGALYHSGFTGYIRLTGKSPVTEKVFPFYETFGIPVVQGGAELPDGYRYKKNLADTSGFVTLSNGGAFKPDILASHGAILTHPYFSTEEQRKALNQEGVNQVIATHANGPINACFSHKAVLAAFGNLYAPDLFPKQKIYPVRHFGRIDTKTILTDFNDTKTIVLKTPQDTRAEGVDLLDRGSLSLAFNARVADLYLKLFKKPTLRRNHCCVVQSYVRGKSVTAEDKQGNTHAYEPTMRVIATAWHDKGQTFVKCHDAYYKLPAKPEKAGLNRGNSISKVHDSIGPQSAFVPDEDKAVTFSRLEQDLPDLFHPLFTTPSHVLTGTLLQSSDEGDRHAGAALALHSVYFDRPADSPDYPDDIADHVYALVAQKREIIWPLWAEPPDGLKEALDVRARNDGVASRRQISKTGIAIAFALGTVASAIGTAIWPTYSGVVPGGFNQNAKTAGSLFGDPPSKEARFVDEAKNLRIFNFNENAVKLSYIIAAAKVESRENGYKACIETKSQSEAYSLYQALDLALHAPQEKFVSITYNFVSITYNYDSAPSADPKTVIYGTACPEALRL